MADDLLRAPSVELLINEHLTPGFRRLSHQMQQRRPELFDSLRACEEESGSLDMPRGGGA